MKLLKRYYLELIIIVTTLTIIYMYLEGIK